MLLSGNLIPIIFISVHAVFVIIFIVFQAMTLEAYREFQRLGGNKNGLKLGDTRKIWTVTFPPSIDPKREKVRQKFMKHRKRMVWTFMGGVGFWTIVALIVALFSQ